MSPEQAELTRLDVDTRSDVYSLGVLLYELLVGATPFDQRLLRGVGFDEMRRLIREQDPPRPSTRITAMGGEVSQLAAERRRTDSTRLARLLRGDLDWIVMKALEKDRSRRYGSVSELAADLAFHLANEPVVAGPPSASYRLRKFLRRHRVAVTAAGLITFAFVAGIIGTTVGLLQARREAEVSRRSFDFLTGIFTEIDPGTPMGHTSSVREVLDRGAERLDREFVDQPLVRARLMSAVGQAYQGLGAYEQGQPLLEQALAIRREELGNQHPEVVDSLSRLGWLLILDGRYEEARPFLDEALVMGEQLDGADSARVGESLSDLSYLAWKTGEYERARELSERAVRILEQALGPDDFEVGEALSHLQLILRETNDLDGAKLAAERALAIRERTLGPGHTSVGWALHDLAVIHRGRGELDTARTYAERSLAIQEAAVGGDHYAVSFPMSQLALLDNQTGHQQEALHRLEGALAIREQALGPDHPDLAYVLRPYGLVLAASGELDAGRAQLERAVEVTGRAYGPHHLEVAYSLSQLGMIHRHEGDFQGALKHQERALDIAVRKLGPDSVYLQYHLSYLALTCAAAGQREAALEHLGRAVRLGWAHPTFLDRTELDSLRGDPAFEAIAAEVRRRLEEEVPTGPAGESHSAENRE